jgi:hypothetical protein
MIRIGTLVCLLGLVASTARADAIVMPPPCPAGSTDAFCHGPPTCRPRTCTTQSQCSAGEVCAPVALCIDTNTCGGLGPTTSVTNVVGPCDASGGCAMGSCSTMSVCIAGSVADGGSIDGGTAPQHATYCGCRAGTRGGSAVALVAMALAGSVVARRRGSRRR